MIKEKKTFGNGSGVAIASEAASTIGIYYVLAMLLTDQNDPMSEQINKGPKVNNIHFYFTF